jgi:hypothetical protein
LELFVVCSCAEVIFLDVLDDNGSVDWGVLMPRELLESEEMRRS